MSEHAKIGDGARRSDARTSDDPRDFTAMTPVSLTLLSLFAAAFLTRLFRAARDSTLLYAWAWSWLALTAFSVVELVASLADVPRDADWLPPARYSAAILLFCPLMSVLGSKRPHEQAWQWIVLSLWGILVLPAIEWLVLRRGTEMEIHGVRSWFLVILIMMNALHAVGTRGAPAGFFLALAQLIALHESLPFLGPLFERTRLHAFDAAILQQLALGAGLAALAGATWSVRARPDARPLDRVWLDFRDHFGALWALRVIERMNSAATTGRWSHRLHWTGFQLTEVAAGDHGESSVAESEAVAQAFWNLLRRFVSESWCQHRGWSPPGNSGG